MREVEGGETGQWMISLPLILFYESFYSDASQRSGGGKSAPHSRSSLQMSLGCTQMNSSQSLYFTSTREKKKKHTQSQISGVEVWHYSQTQETLPNLKTSAAQTSLHLFILHSNIAQGGMKEF